jgi:hypothetical protein
MLYVPFSGSAATADGIVEIPCITMPSTVIETAVASGGLSAYSSNCRPAPLFQRDVTFRNVTLLSASFSHSDLEGQPFGSMSMPACGAVPDVRRNWQSSTSTFVPLISESPFL